MIILKFKINPNNVLIFSFRNTDLSLLDYEKTYIKPKKIDKYFEKYFFKVPQAIEFLKKLKHTINHFYYTRQLHLER